MCGAMRRKWAVDPGSRVFIVIHGSGHDNRRHTLVPAKRPFSLECLPQTVYWVLVEQPNVSAVRHDFCRLVVHSRQRLASGQSE